MVKRTLILDFGDLTESQVSDMMDAAAYNLGYKDEIVNQQSDGTLLDENKSPDAKVDNPQTKLDFLGSRLTKFAGDNAETYLRKQAQQQADETKKQEVQSLREKVSYEVQ